MTELPRFGSGVRGLFRFDEVTKKCVPCDAPKKLVVEAPSVITDEIAPTMSMTGTDKIHTSKATLRREYKELGFIETGGERLPPPKYIRPKIEEIREDAAKALNDLRYGNAPMTEWEKEVNLREEREWKAYKKRQMN